MGFFSSLSFLAPLYVAAGLAISLPIVLHLIRRTPRGRQVFSSLMFLSPSPPRITRRSRLENWLLLILRGLAVLLIVAAFCRPLWRKLQAVAGPGSVTETVLLVDRSASLRRDGVWDEAVAEARTVIDAAGAADRLAVLTFDDTVQTVVAFEEWDSLDAASRGDLAADRLAGLSPTWRATELGSAMTFAAELLERSDAASGTQVERRLVIVTDLQEGSRWESLQQFEWPENVAVDLRVIGRDTQAINAGLQVVGQPEQGEAPFVRLRVANSSVSTREMFQVGWRDPLAAQDGPPVLAGAVDVYVPPGQSRVVKLPQTGTEAFVSGEAVLVGDDQPFDNSAFVAWPERRRLKIVWLGTDAPNDRNGLRFFIEPTFPSTASRDVVVHEGWPSDESSSAAPVLSDEEPPTLAILAGAAADPAAREYLEAGGTVLYVCRPDESDDALRELTGVSGLVTGEGEVDDYLLLREVDFGSPLFSALSDPRFSDLSKVHFWKYRRLDLDRLPGARVLAAFDNGDPLLVEWSRGNGRLYLLTSGWNRGESQLATWSKFVPVMNALLADAAGDAGPTRPLVVGDTPPPLSSRAATTAEDSDKVILEFQSHSGWVTADSTGIPGIYRQRRNSDRGSPRVSAIAVNLADSESRTAPLSPEPLLATGIRLTGDDDSPIVTASQHEQLARAELEGRQKLWRWLLVAAGLVLVAETLVAAGKPRLESPAVDAAS
jgi:hypothetical protein